MSHQTELPPPNLVTKPHQLDLLVTHLAHHPAVAVDTESNSLHAYQERVCLIQFSLPGADYLVDPLAGLDLASLGDVLANPQIEKVFHAAEYDVMCLRRDFGWEFDNLFDTMLAARILGWPRIGLGNILEEQFGVHLNKRWQRYDWGERPLNPEALAYAQLDTHYLLSLHERVLAELQNKNRLEEARAVFVQVAKSEPAFRDFDPDQDLWRVKGVWDLAGESQAILRELLVWRDQEARRRDRPPFKVLGDRTLLALAQSRPQSMGGLARIDGLKQHHVRRYGRKLLWSIKQGLHAPAPTPPRQHPRPDQVVVDRYEALRRWRKRRAQVRGVDPDVIVSNAALWILASHRPLSLADLAALKVLDGWKQEAYGQALLDVLRKNP